MTPKEHQPFVPENTKMLEFTWRAVLLGLVLTVVLGAANAYLGLRAGQTIAATYPAAVISMAALRLLGATHCKIELSDCGQCPLKNWCTTAQMAVKTPALTA